MVKLIHHIQQQEKRNGAAVATGLNKQGIYQHDTNLYNALHRLKELDLIKEQEAPNTASVDKTFTTTKLGEKILEKTINAGLIE